MHPGMPPGYPGYPDMNPMGMADPWGGIHPGMMWPSMYPPDMAMAAHQHSIMAGHPGMPRPARSHRSRKSSKSKGVLQRIVCGSTLFVCMRAHVLPGIYNRGCVPSSLCSVGAQTICISNSSSHLPFFSIFIFVSLPLSLWLGCFLCARQVQPVERPPIESILQALSQ